MKYLVYSNSGRQKVEWRSPRAEKNGEFLFNGYRVSVMQDEEFWRWIVIMVAQQGEST